MIKHYQLKISGRVQGVAFRASTQDKARELGIKGFVRNEADGGVYVEAEGLESSLEELLRWCRQGPPAARVADVKVKEAAPKGYDQFEIRY